MSSYVYLVGRQCVRCGILLVRVSHGQPARSFFLDFWILDFYFILFDRKKPNLDASGYAQLWHSIEGTELNPPYHRDIGTRVGIVPQHIE
jgi:hypothetical protein